MARRSGLLLIAGVLAMLSTARADPPPSDPVGEPGVSARPAPRPAPVPAVPGGERVPPAERERPRWFIPPAEPPAPHELEAPGRAVWSGFVQTLEPHVRRSLARVRWVPRWRQDAPAPGPPRPGREPDPDGLGRRSPPFPDGGDGSGLPFRLALGTVVPNPTPGSLWLRLDLPAAARVGLVVLDVTGRVVHERDESRAAGRHSLTWSSRAARGGAAPPGVYFVRVSVDGRVLGTRRYAVVP